jgi:DNA-binding beta-propeller fold protein YncE
VPYGIASDPKRDLAWVTLTASNEVVGFDMTGGAPVQRYRLPTVRQPNSVAVDPDSGRVFVASANGEGVSVIQP